MNSTSTQHDLQAILHTMKQAHLDHGPASAQLRRDRLMRAVALIRDHSAAISQAIHEDFGHRSLYQSMVADVATTIGMLEYAAEHVAQWMKPTVVETGHPDIQARIMDQPLGVVGIISPWNFPVNLSFGPLAGLFAAGNTAMLKPSELTPKTSELLAELIGRYFDPTELSVVLGGVEMAQAFSALPFDHLVFTGSTTVGRQVMRAAAENLVPVTLELGGKSPVMVDEYADIKQVAERTLTIKTFNAGQICLSPDYMLLPEHQVDALTQAAQRFMADSFPTVQSNDDYTAIISARHYQRLVGLLNDARQRGATIVSLAPEDEPAMDDISRKIAPHLVIGVDDSMAIMQEEIFGPLLPVKTYRQAHDAIDYINAHPRPLAAYFFGWDEQRQKEFSERTTSGALVINDVMTHASIEGLPFGGVGASGMGAYHGIHGFKQFSHAKPVVVQRDDGTSNQRLRAPYQAKQEALAQQLK